MKIEKKSKRHWIFLVRRDIPSTSTCFPTAIACLAIHRTIPYHDPLPPKDVHTRAPVDLGVCSAGLARTKSTGVPAHIKLRIRAYARTPKLAFVACFTPLPMPAEMVRLQKTRQCLLAGSQRATLEDTWPCRFFALFSCNGLPPQGHICQLNLALPL